jgi:hypothetical protein
VTENIRVMKFISARLRSDLQNERWFHDLGFALQVRNLPSMCRYL